mgnify:CR=1 FL=1
MKKKLESHQLVFIMKKERIEFQYHYLIINMMMMMAIIFIIGNKREKILPWESSSSYHIQHRIVRLVQSLSSPSSSSIDLIHFAKLNTTVYNQGRSL